ncbi:hypothetical protein CDV36_005606 [Fusarium kuroshium]|uniref:Ig-like domain-containing protein n=1 Tax=Fusarium kuroshium TaxID=2010991 RepID=A0A3M2SAW9_9HYPO|nr:hypothetical protein CDV36_005606 [Fusarium kuroshium]
MNRRCRIVPFMVLVLQALISTRAVQASDDEVIGYAEDGSYYSTLSCRTSATYSSSTTYSGNPRTYGFCYTSGDGYHQVRTSCRGNTVYFTGWSSGFDNPSGSYTWYSLTYPPVTGENSISDSIPSPTGSCVTATIYPSYTEPFASLRTSYIYCATEDLMPSYFTQHPSDWPTTSSTTSSNEPTTVTVTGSRPTLPGDPIPPATSTDDSDSESQTGAPRPSEAGKGGPNSGVIAGAVVGALAGVALLAGTLLLGFRMGRRHPQLGNQETRPNKSFRDTINSLPRPTIAWSRPKAKGTPERDLQNDVSVLQVNFSDATTGKRTSELPSPAPQKPVNQTQIIPPPTSQPYSTATVESYRVELPTGPESQGWARSDAHPSPYEVDGTPNNRTSSP